MGRPEIVDPDAANAHWRGFPGYWSDIYRDQARERQGERTDLQANIPHLSGECIHGAGKRDLDTDHRLAKEAGTSHDTIHRVRVLEREASPEVKAALKAGHVNSRDPLPGVDRQGWTNTRIAKEAGQ